MNKYQEALKWFQSIHDVLGQEQYYEDLGMRFGQGLHESLQTIKELVDKETPKKPKNIRFDNLRDSFGGKCECDSIVYEFHMYCPDCGQKLDWSEE